MRKITPITLAVLALVGGLATASALRAQDRTDPATRTCPAQMDHDAMMGGDTPGMIKITSEMAEMMEKCNAMMQTTGDRAKQ